MKTIVLGLYALTAAGSAGAAVTSYTRRATVTLPAVFLPGSRYIPFVMDGAGPTSGTIYAIKTSISADYAVQASWDLRDAMIGTVTNRMIFHGPEAWLANGIQMPFFSNFGADYELYRDIVSGRPEMLVGNYSVASQHTHTEFFGYRQYYGDEPFLELSGAGTLVSNFWIENEDLALPTSAQFSAGYPRPAGSVTYNIAYTLYAGSAPEPASWVLIFAGFGLVGDSMRRRSRLLAP